MKKEHLLEFEALVEAGLVTPVIKNTYALGDTARAMQDVGAGHVCGKVLITV